MKRIVGIAACAAVLFSFIGHDTLAEPPIPIERIKENQFKNVVLLPSPTPASAIVEPDTRPLPTRPTAPAPTAELKIQMSRTNETTQKSDNFLQSWVSWYGPGFYGKRTACGLAYTETIIGVAHRTLPCGTLVDFRYKGITVRAKVIDRGPYVSGRQWDLTGGLCTALNHCFTGAIEFRIVR